jgi:hypothetical protein
VTRFDELISVAEEATFTPHRWECVRGTKDELPYVLQLWQSLDYQAPPPPGLNGWESRLDRGAPPETRTVEVKPPKGVFGMPPVTKVVAIERNIAGLVGGPALSGELYQAILGYLVDALEKNPGVGGYCSLRTPPSILRAEEAPALALLPRLRELAGAR